MSNVFFDKQWEDAMQGLIGIMELEIPQNPTLAPQNLVDYSVMYVRYLQIYKKLEDCYDQVVHPQKRIYLKKTLDACIGRILEINEWMVHLNAGKDQIKYEDTLIHNHLEPDVLDIIPPRFLTLDNAENLEMRENFLIKSISDGEELTSTDGDVALEELTEDEAISIIQANERGRQGRKRIANLAKLRQLQEEALRRQQAGEEHLTPEAAAIIIQTYARGFLGRCRVKHSTEDELVLIGMEEPFDNEPRDLAFTKAKENAERRKKYQLLTYNEFMEAMAMAKEQLKELEGQEMREIIQEKISQWLNANRDPDTGFYPPFPKPDEGGSRYILEPPPKLDIGEDDKKKKKGGKGTKDDKKKKKPKVSCIIPRVELPEEDEDKPPACPAFFLRHLRECLQLYNRIWHDKDDSINLGQKHDYELLKSTLRPSVFEEVRLEVDDSTRIILEKVKQKILAELKAARKKQKKGEKGKEKKAPKKEKKGKEKEEPPPPKPKPKKPKDPTAQRTIESLFFELAKNGIVQCCPRRTFSEYAALDTFAGMDASDSELSMAEVKRLVIQYCILPLASDFVHGNAPFIKSVLLYGGELNGKTLLVHAACRAAGANFINLSPEVLDGKYPGKQAIKMLQMVFKVAKIMAPTIVYVSGVEKLFVTDRKKIKAYGFKDKPNRIKRPLMKEVNSIKPGDRVLFLCTSSRPQDAPGKSSAFMNFFTKRIYVPFPDYGNRILLWRTLIERNGGIITSNFDLFTVAHLSNGYSVGALERICKIVLTGKRKRKLKKFPLLIDEVMTVLYQTKPVDPAFHQTLKEWGKPKQASERQKKGKDVKGKSKKK